MSNYDYTIEINQAAVIENNLPLDLIDMAIFSSMCKYANQPKCQKRMSGTIVYWQMSYEKVLENLPLLPIKTVDAIFRRFKKLEQAGVIEGHEDNTKRKGAWYCWGHNYEKLTQKQFGFKTELEQKEQFSSDLKPNQFGFKTESVRIESRTINTEIPFTEKPSTINTQTRASEIEKAIESLKEEKKEVEVFAPGAAQSTFETWLSEITGNYKVKEGFTITNKIPSEKFDDYATRFIALARMQEEKYQRSCDVRGHFLYWTRDEYKRETEAEQKSKPSFQKTDANGFNAQGVRRMGNNMNDFR